MGEQEKIDLGRLFKAQYTARSKPTLVEVGSGRYLAIEGRGAPGGDDYVARIGALYSMAYTVKMTRKYEGRGDYTVSKLECRWWGPRGRVDLSGVPQEEWRWQLLIRTPELVEQADLDRAVAALTERGKGEHTDRVELLDLDEGLCLQMLHVGPYDQVGRTIEAMGEFAAAEGYTFRGRHHEIYISDPRRVPPERLKTIVRRCLRRK